MARKPVRKQKGGPATPKARVSRDKVVTFRISAEEADLIAKAADRVPLARYSRDAVLVRATADLKK